MWNITGKEIRVLRGFRKQSPKKYKITNSSNNQVAGFLHTNVSQSDWRSDRRSLSLSPPTRNLRPKPRPAHHYPPSSITFPSPSLLSLSLSLKSQFDRFCFLPYITSIRYIPSMDRFSIPVSPIDFSFHWIRSTVLFFFFSFFAFEFDRFMFCIVLCCAFFVVAEELVEDSDL